MKKYLIVAFLSLSQLLIHKTIYAIENDTLRQLKVNIKKQLQKEVIESLDFDRLIFFSDKQKDTILIIPIKRHEPFMSNFLLVDYKMRIVKNVVWVKLYRSRSNFSSLKTDSIEIKGLSKTIRKIYIVDTISGNVKIMKLFKNKFKTKEVDFEQLRKISEYKNYAIPHIIGSSNEDKRYSIGILNIEWLLNLSDGFPFYNGKMSTYSQRYISFIDRYFGLLELELDNSINAPAVNL